MLLALTGILVISWCLLFFTSNSVRLGQELTINTAHGWFYPIVIVVGVLALIGSIWALSANNGIGVVSLVAVVVSPVVMFFAGIFEAGDYSSVAMARDVDGTEYHLLDSHFLQGSSLAIGRLTKRNAFQTKFDLLIESGCEDTFGFLSLVRPNRKTDECLIALTSNHVVVGAEQGYKCYLAYDLRNRKAYSQSGNSSGEVSTSIQSMSPFVLLGPHDLPKKEDYKLLFDPKSTGLPDVKAVEADLQNPNPAVRVMARRYIDHVHSHPLPAK